MKLDLNKLAEYNGDIELIDIDNKKWTGTIYGVTPKYDNPEEKDSLDLKIKNDIYIFFDDEVKSIKYIK